MKVSQEILAILSGLTLTGNKAIIAAQLDRKTYVAVNKVLEACGGKWDRRAAAHVFPGDAAERLDQVILTGEVETAKDLGFFATPPDLAAELVAMANVRPGDRTLEPSAGDGALLRPLLSAGAYIVAVEIDPARCDVLVERYGQKVAIWPGDFLEMTTGSFDRVVMNPPFGKIGGHDHLDHVRHAWSFLRPQGVLVSVLPSGVTFRQDRRHAEFRSWVASLGGEIQDLPDGSFKESGTGVRTCVLRIVRGAE